MVDGICTIWRIHRATTAGFISDKRKIRKGIRCVHVGGNLDSATERPPIRQALPYSDIYSRNRPGLDFLGNIPVKGIHNKHKAILVYSLIVFVKGIRQQHHIFPDLPL